MFFHTTQRVFFASPSSRVKVSTSTAIRIRDENFFMAAALVKNLTQLLTVPIIEKDLTATAASRQTAEEARRAI